MAISTIGTSGINQAADTILCGTSGNVGIGTSLPKNLLDLNGSITMRPTYGTYLVNSYYNSGWKYIGDGAAWGIGDNFGGVSNGVTIARAAVNASGANAGLTWSPALSIDTSDNLRFNSGYGSVATAYGCRAWVNFNGTGTVAIRASGNVSSITDGGTGIYTVNLSTAMPDTNYGFSFHASWNDTSSAQMSAGRRSNTTVTTTALQFNTFNGLGSVFSLIDSPEVCVEIFR